MLPAVSLQDPVAAAALRVALELQQRDLHRVLHRVERAEVFVGRGADGVGWDGPARWAYDLALDNLRGELMIAAALLRQARDETMTALDTVATRVG